MDIRLYFLQRATAALLAIFVTIHLALIAYAVQDGLSADEILSRTRGSLGWGLFYGFFVLAAAIHGAIGLRTILVEWTGLGPRGAGRAGWLVGALLLIWGLRAVMAVTSGDVS